MQCFLWFLVLATLHGNVINGSIIRENNSQQITNFTSTSALGSCIRTTESSVHKNDHLTSGVKATIIATRKYSFVHPETNRLRKSKITSNAFISDNSSQWTLVMVKRTSMSSLNSLTFEPISSSRPCIDSRILHSVTRIIETNAFSSFRFSNLRSSSVPYNASFILKSDSSSPPSAKAFQTTSLSSVRNVTVSSFTMTTYRGTRAIEPSLNFDRFSTKFQSTPILPDLIYNTLWNHENVTNEVSENKNVTNKVSESKINVTKKVFDYKRSVTIKSNYTDWPSFFSSYYYAHINYTSSATKSESLFNNPLNRTSKHLAREFLLENTTVRIEITASSTKTNANQSRIPKATKSNATITSYSKTSSSRNYSKSSRNSTFSKKYSSSFSRNFSSSLLNNCSSFTSFQPRNSGSSMYSSILISTLLLSTTSAVLADNATSSIHSSTASKITSMSAFVTTTPKTQPTKSDFYKSLLQYAVAGRLKMNFIDALNRLDSEEAINLSALIKHEFNDTLTEHGLLGSIIHNFSPGSVVFDASLYFNTSSTVNNTLLTQQLKSASLNITNVTVAEICSLATCGSWGRCNASRDNICRCDLGFRGKRCNEAYPVNGTVRVWSSWTTCSKSCDAGSRTRVGVCYPTPRNGGVCRSGKQTTTQAVACNEKECGDDDHDDDDYYLVAWICGGIFTSILLLLCCFCYTRVHRQPTSKSLKSEKFVDPNNIYSQTPTIYTKSPAIKKSEAYTHAQRMQTAIRQNHTTSRQRQQHVVYENNTEMHQVTNNNTDKTTKNTTKANGGGYVNTNDVIITRSDVSNDYAINSDGVDNPVFYDDVIEESDSETIYKRQLDKFLREAQNVRSKKIYDDSDSEADAVRSQRPADSDYEDVPSPPQNKKPKPQNKKLKLAYEDTPWSPAAVKNKKKPKPAPRPTNIQKKIVDRGLSKHSLVLM